MIASTNHIIKHLIVVFVLVTTTPTFAASIIYVDADATGANNGSSWADAYQYLDYALLDDDWTGDEIRVAQGIYRPGEGYWVIPDSYWRIKSFQLINGVTIKGGYAGFGEPDPDARDIELYETILSGDLLGNDGPNFANNGDNSYHVVTGSGTDATAVLDGFIITGGNANVHPHTLGGGMYNSSGSPTLRNCTIRENFSLGDGAGIRSGSPGGPTLYCCSLIRNLCGNGYGGGISSNKPILINCTVSGNSAVWAGGISCGGGTMINCLFNGNTSERSGGGMAFWDCNPGPTLINCTFSSNTAGDMSGGIYMPDSGVSLLNCILWGNSDINGMYESSQIYANEPIVVDYSCIQGLTGTLGGIGNIGADPCFVNPNTGDYHLLPDSPSINTGDPDYVSGPNDTDLDGRSRIIGGRIDMGVYEFQGRLILYVDDDAAGANDGSSWDNAYKYLQEALSTAYSGDEIRVAQGIYKPDQGVGQTPGDREATFHLINGVTLKGGYAGAGAPDPNARDIELYETILSGDLNGDDGPNFSNNEENSYQVVTAISVGSTTVLDGLIITAGNANHPHYLSMKISGGGVYMLYSSPTIIDCIFTWNSAAYGGAGLYNYKGDPVLTNCTVHNNLATSHPHYGGSGYGAGMHNSTGSPILTNCVFSNNHAKGRYPGDFGGTGGGLSCYVETSNDLDKGPTLIDCIFNDNIAQSAGGGMCPGIGNTTLFNCIFTRNYAEDGGAMATAPRMMANCLLYDNSAEYGGAMYLCEDKNNLIKNCTFVANSATFIGGIADCEDSIANLTNCILFNNTSSGVADEQAQIYLPYGATVLNYNCIQGWSGDLGGIGNIGDNPLFVDPNNHDFHLLPDSPCINAGEPDYVAEPNETDLDGNPRVMGGRIDMGVYEYSPTITAETRIVPQTINLASKGNWITCYIWLPDEYDVIDIEPNIIFLKDEIQPEQFLLNEEQQLAIAKFDRDKVQAILDVGEIELTITGRLTDGTIFEASDTIKVIDKAGK